MEFYNELTQKWGHFKKVNHWLEQVITPFISDQAKLNLLFDPIEHSVIADRFNKAFGVSPPRFLLEFYQITNGCRLFSNSLCIYGFKLYLAVMKERFDSILI